ncbi:hypothetical protein NDU88_002989 [Pleurodeles waltl]|uniref:Uncharacterized protein n=1 Tax=Pleurodeles waltl TaxID=8319 RepID=A0AAV7P897_PLEWA|nr:hypothetical protein NDU88_002989 [Pleurodeles waltl]
MREKSVSRRPPTSASPRIKWQSDRPAVPDQQTTTWKKQTRKKKTAPAPHMVDASVYILMSLILKWACLTLRLLWRVARAVLKEYPGVLKDPLAPSDSCGVAARADQKQCSGVLGNPLTLSDSCGSVARAVPSVLAGGAC